MQAFTWQVWPASPPELNPQLQKVSEAPSRSGTRRTGDGLPVLCLAYPRQDVMRVCALVEKPVDKFSQEGPVLHLLHDRLHSSERGPPARSPSPFRGRCLRLGMEELRGGIPVDLGRAGPGAEPVAGVALLQPSREEPPGRDGVADAESAEDKDEAPQGDQHYGGGHGPIRACNSVVLAELLNPQADHEPPDADAEPQVEYCPCDQHSLMLRADLVDSVLQVAPVNHDFHGKAERRDEKCDRHLRTSEEGQGNDAQRPSVVVAEAVLRRARRRALRVSSSPAHGLRALGDVRRQHGRVRRQRGRELAFQTRAYSEERAC
mmetsp:Transcript_25298/g.72490  ORF Transcript_25298/g.72490 Transcript_25298/m.72490 type:complete len:319 (+) Transcript_25298:38-994(+)